MMPWVGLALLLFVGLGVVLTGLPVPIILIVAASLGAVIGAVNGQVPIDLLAALPERLINLLENDLVQAIPLYVVMGVLINRLPVAEALYRLGLAILPRSRAAPVVSGIALGALIGPMNGSVGASVLALSRVLAPRLEASGIPLPRRAAIITVASTLGVVVPPSLVLILLGDAMLAAHTIAVTATGRDDRVINTQDLFHGALAPAGIYLVACLLIAWCFNRATPNTTGRAAGHGRLRPQQAAIGVFALLAILTLLGGVTLGYFYAVEAAAMGGFALLIVGFVSRRLSLPVLGELLRDALALTGTLFFMLMAATTLTLVLRVLGTDQLVAGWIAAIPGGPLAAVAVVLGGIWLCALVLDAFEIIFVVVPIVIPPLLIRVDDAVWVAVLVLLVVQTSFLDPLVGYSVMMTRTVLRASIEFLALLRSLLPFLLAQWALLIAVLLLPSLAHIGQTEADRSRKPPDIPAEELDRRIQQMLAPEPEAPSTKTAPSR
ncbi:MAG TPA: TRAP transporter large permease subunit [Casimicrobiaceae bacterium]|nr:TRAP transporter large permease subunit [Casimicrobiaceae bacterium]